MYLFVLCAVSPVNTVNNYYCTGTACYQFTYFLAYSLYLCFWSSESRLEREWCIIPERHAQAYIEGNPLSQGDSCSVKVRKKKYEAVVGLRCMLVRYTAVIHYNK